VFGRPFLTRSPGSSPRAHPAAAAGRRRLVSSNPLGCAQVMPKRTIGASEWLSDREIATEIAMWVTEPKGVDKDQRLRIKGKGHLSRSHSYKGQKPTGLNVTLFRRVMGDKKLFVLSVGYFGFGTGGEYEKESDFTAEEIERYIKVARKYHEEMSGKKKVPRNCEGCDC
jgi:hypothetical protein